MPSVTRARSRPSSSRELATDPIEHSSDSGLVMPESHIQGIDDAPNLDAACRKRTRIFPLDEDGDEILDQHSSFVVPSVARRHERGSFGGVDSLLAKRTKRLQEERETGNRRSTKDKKRPARSRREGSRLSKLIARCNTDEEVAELKAAWEIPAGRRKVCALTGSSSEEDNDDAPPVRRRRTRGAKKDAHQPPAKRRRRTARAILDSEDEGEKSVHDDQNDSDRESEETPKRRGRSSAESRRLRKERPSRQDRGKSVPLPKSRGTLMERLSSRAAVPSNGTEKRRLTRAAAAKMKEAAGREKPGTRGRRRNRRDEVTELSDSEEDIEADCEVANGMLSDSSNEGEEDVGAMEAEILAGEEDDQSDLDFVDEEPAPSPRKRRNNRKTQKKKNNRRKRTRPKNAFESNVEELSAREQRQRLDFLVKQSADIARELHKAMADAANERPNGGPKSPARKGDSQAATGDTSGVEVVQESSQSAPVVEEEFAQPTAEGKKLQPHQTDGVKWLLTLDAQGLNAILADEMGLGKTIQTLAFLASLVINGKRGPHLVVAPKNVCEHWAAEVRAWYPGQINIVTYLGHAEERLENMRDYLEEDNFDIMVTSFEVALRDLFHPKRHVEGVFAPYSKVLRAFRKVEFEYLVVDEAHRLKNDKSQMNIGIRNYKCAQRRLLLTGTPLSNDLKELWCLMNILNPKIFSSKARFETWFSAPFESGRGSRKGAMTHAEQSAIVDRLHTIIRPFFRRRVRADVCPSFTSADEILIRCPMSNLQKALMLHFRRRADDKDASKNNILMAMRGVSSHPYMSSHALYDGEQSQATPRLVSTCGKFAFLHYSLPRLLAGGHRVLIFSQFRRALDFLEDLMDLLHIKYGRLDGMTTSEDRIAGLRAFNAPGSELQVYLLSTRAGGVGINLQTADTVILFDSDWNPSADLQAVSRIQRIGQTRTVHIMRLLTENAVDSIILETSKRKLRTQAVAVGAGKFNTSSGAALDQKLRQKDLEQLIQELDIQAFLPIEADDEVTVVPTAQSSPESISPDSLEKSVREKYFKEWSRQLLRPGETELPDVAQAAIWLDSVEDCAGCEVPKWLGKDAVLVAAGRALECMNRFAAAQVYEDTVQSIALVGAFSKKDRASRARRKTVADTFFDLGSDGDGDEDPSEDPTISIEQPSDVSDDEYFEAEDGQRNDGEYLEAEDGQRKKPDGKPGSVVTPSPLKPPSAVNGQLSSPTITGGPRVGIEQTPGKSKSRSGPTMFPSTGISPNRQTPALQNLISPQVSAGGVPVPGPWQALKALPNSLHGIQASMQPVKSAYAQRPLVPRSTSAIQYLALGSRNTGAQASPRPALPQVKSVSKPRRTAKKSPAESRRPRVTGSTGLPQAVTPLRNMSAFRKTPILPKPMYMPIHMRYPEVSHPMVSPPLMRGIQAQHGNARQGGVKTAHSQSPGEGRRENYASGLVETNGMVGKGAGLGAIQGTAPHGARFLSHGMPTAALGHSAPTGASSAFPSPPLQRSFSNATASVQNGTRVSNVQAHVIRPAWTGAPLDSTTSFQRHRKDAIPLVAIPTGGVGTVPAPAARQSNGALQGSAGSVGVASAVGQQILAAPYGARMEGLGGTPGTLERRNSLSDPARDGNGLMWRPYSAAAAATGSAAVAAAAAAAGAPKGSEVDGKSMGGRPRGKAGETLRSSAGAMASARLAAIVADAPRVQGEAADQGSPLFSRNPRTIGRGGGSARRVLSLGGAVETDKVYSVKDLQRYMKSVEQRHGTRGVTAETFGALVKQLQDATKVNDIDFLADALLESGCNIGDAADYIYQRIS